jgi:hypothetical protein
MWNTNIRAKQLGCLSVMVNPRQGGGPGTLDVVGQWYKQMTVLNGPGQGD